MTQDHCCKIFTNLCNIRHYQASIQREDHKRRRLRRGGFDKDTTVSQNHRMTRVGRDLKGHESSTPLPGRATSLPSY